MTRAKNFRRWHVLVLVSLLLSLILPLASVATSYAATSCSWTSATAISCNDIAYSQTGTNGNTMTLASSADKCDTITIQNYQTATTGTEVNASPNAHTGVGCGSGLTSTIDLTNTNNSVTGNTTSSSTSQSPELVCTVVIDNPLTWAICPLISAAQAAIDQISNAIDALLTINVNSIFGSTTQAGTESAGLYEAWNDFRILSVGLIIIAALIMLIAQAVGSEFVDAYTIRKLMPPLLAVIVFISLSWWIWKFAITLSNDAGTGMRSIIYAPFASVGSGQVRLGGGTSSGLAAAALIGSGSLLSLGLVGLGSLALTAFLAVMAAFAMLIIRQLVVMALIVFSPIAIACYVLPGAKGGWTAAKDIGVGMLVATPFIEVVIALGRVGAVLMYNSNNGLPDVAKQAGALLLWFVPYLFVLTILRRATRSVEFLTGAVHDLHNSRAQGRAKKRQERTAQRKELAATNSLYSPDSFMGKFRNNAASWATAPYSNLAYEAASRSNRNIPFLSKTGKRVGAGIQAKRMSQNGELLKVLNDQFSYNDKAYRALSGAHEGFDEDTQKKLKKASLFDQAPSSMKDIEAMANILETSGSATEQLAAGSLRASAGYLGNLYSSTDTNKADSQAAGIMGLASHGFASGEDLATVANQMEKKGHGYAEAVGVQSQVLGQRSRPDVKAGYGLVYKKGQNGQQDRWVSGVSEEGGRALGLMKTLSSHDLASAKGGTIGALKPAIMETLQGRNGKTPAESANNAKAMEEQLFSWAGPYSQASMDVKAQALQIIDDMSGGIQTLTDKNGREYQGYTPGSIGANFDRYRRAEAAHDPGAHGGHDGPPDDGNGGH